MKKFEETVVNWNDDLASKLEKCDTSEIGLAFRLVHSMNSVSQKYDIPGETKREKAFELAQKVLSENAQELIEQLLVIDRLQGKLEFENYFRDEFSKIVKNM